jgi:ElaB/YqjD/DUF883 family membrane-anchored ribosome-binding protein
MAESKDKINAELDSLKSDIGRLSRDVSALLSVFKQAGTDQVGGVKESLDEEVARRRDEIIASFQQVQDRGESTAASLEEEVIRHPMRSVLIAFGIGYLASKVLRSR